MFLVKTSLAKTIAHGFSNGNQEYEEYNDQMQLYFDMAAEAVYAEILPLLSACILMVNDYQTSDTHHPEHILINRKDFELIKDLLGDLNVSTN